MARSRRSRGLQVLSMGLAALPIAFGLIRAIRTGHDLRYIWVALASLCGAIATVAIARPARRTPRTAAAISVSVFVIATLSAVLAALMLGTTLGLGILVVAFSFGFCFAAGSALRILSRR